MNASHRQVWVKVNAPVDEGVAGLVSALSKVDGLETIESCQGSPDGSPAFVFFRLGDWRRCGAYLFDHLLPAIPQDLRECVTVEIRSFDRDSTIARLSVEVGAIPAVTACVGMLGSSVSPSIPMAGDAHGLAVAQVV